MSQCKHSFPGSFLTSHIHSLLTAIVFSLASSVALGQPNSKPKPKPVLQQYPHYIGPPIQIPRPQYLPVPVSSTPRFSTFQCPPSISAPRIPLREVNINSPAASTNIVDDPASESVHPQNIIKLSIKRVREADPQWYEDFVHGNKQRRKVDSIKIRAD